MYSDLQNKNNPKPFWKYVKNLGLNKNKISVLKRDGKIHREINEQINAFSDYFSSVYTVPNSEVVNETISHNCNHAYVETLSVLKVTRQETYMQMLACKTDKAKGPDNIPPVFLKKCAWELSIPLTILFNQSLESGMFPSRLKIANVVPILKKGDAEDAANYRPISLLSTISKLFETIVCKHFYNHVKKYISDRQHGFCEGKSTTTNLCAFWDYVIEAIEGGCQVDAIYTDFAKAFDTVNHAYLIHKLSKLGIHGSLLNWCKSYLADRYQRVIYNGFLSKSTAVTSGVPQGSALGPLFFIVFINDLADLLDNCGIPHLFFADDLKIYLKIKTDDDHLKLQTAMNCLSNWSKTWDLKLNIDKCHVITFHSYRNLNPQIHTYVLDNINLERVSSVNDLGVLLQSNCLFTQHIKCTVRKAFKMLGLLKRSLYFVNDAKTIVTIYNAIVKSVLSYGCVLWNPSQHYLVNELERVQRHLIRYLCFKCGLKRDCYTYEELCQKFEIPTLQQYRISLGLNFLYNLIHNKIQCSELLKQLRIHVPSVSIRNNSVFAIPAARTDYKKRLWHYSLTSYCNEKNLNPFTTYSNWRVSVRRCVSM
jgi:hypothetical protein